MKTMTMGALCALVMVLGGCMAEEPGVADDVASQQSAVEGAPAPDPTEDMRYINHDACDQWCLNKWSDDTRTCADRNPGGTSTDIHHPGPGTPGYWQCLDNANASDEQCSLACDVIFGGTFPRGGSGGTGNLPGNSPLVGDEAPAPTEEQMQIIRDACDRSCDSRAAAGHDVCSASFFLNSSRWWACEENVYQGFSHCTGMCAVLDPWNDGGDIGVP